MYDDMRETIAPFHQIDPPGLSFHVWLLQEIGTGLSLPHLGIRTSGAIVGAEGRTSFAYGETRNLPNLQDHQNLEQNPQHSNYRCQTRGTNKQFHLSRHVHEMRPTSQTVESLTQLPFDEFQTYFNSSVWHPMLWDKWSPHNKSIRMNSITLTSKKTVSTLPFAPWCTYHLAWSAKGAAWWSYRPRPERYLCSSYKSLPKAT